MLTLLSTRHFTGKCIQHCPQPTGLLKSWVLGAEEPHRQSQSSLYGTSTTNWTCNATQGIQFLQSTFRGSQTCINHITPQAKIAFIFWGYPLSPQQEIRSNTISNEDHIKSLLVQ